MNRFEFGYSKNYVNWYQMAGVHIVPGAWYLERIYWAMTRMVTGVTAISVDGFLVKSISTISGHDEGFSGSYCASIGLEERGQKRYLVSFPLIHEQPSAVASREFSVTLDEINAAQPADNDRYSSSCCSQAEGSFPASLYEDMLPFGVVLKESFAALDLSRTTRLGGSHCFFLAGDANREWVGLGAYHAVFQALTFHLVESVLNDKCKAMLVLPAGFSCIIMYPQEGKRPSLVVVDGKESAGNLGVSLRDETGGKLIEITGCKTCKISIDEFKCMVNSFISGGKNASSEARAVASKIQDNLSLLADMDQTSDNKKSLVAAIIFLWASKLIPWRVVSDE